MICKPCWGNNKILQNKNFRLQSTGRSKVSRSTSGEHCCIRFGTNKNLQNKSFMLQSTMLWDYLPCYVKELQSTMLWNNHVLHNKSFTIHSTSRLKASRSILKNNKWWEQLHSFGTNSILQNKNFMLQSTMLWNNLSYYVKSYNPSCYETIKSSKTRNLTLQFSRRLKVSRSILKKTEWWAPLHSFGTN